MRILAILVFMGDVVLFGEDLIKIATGDFERTLLHYVLGVGSVIGWNFWLSLAFYLAIMIVPPITVAAIATQYTPRR